MINYLWAFMIIIGIVYGAFTGKMADISTTTISSAKEAVTLCITMLGVMSLWMGLMEVARGIGLMDQLTRKLRPLLKILFPDIPKDHIVNEYIASNMIANILGLGWAATPVGLKAMKELATLNKNSKFASCDMCTFLIINISSLQLIPVNIIAYRSQYGAMNPSDILGVSILVTLCSTLVGVAFSIIARKLSKKPKY